MPELHLEILKAPQRKLWGAIQQDSAIIREQHFVLAGGTALALQLGHRESYDFDFFSQFPSVEPVRTWIERFPDCIIRDSDPATIHAEIADVKMSFIAGYKFPFISPLVQAGVLSLASPLEIGLMKMLSITHRATVRDYIDLAAILRIHPLRLLIEKCEEKYGASFNVMLALRTMVHFDDLDAEIPVILDASLKHTWKEILMSAVKEVTK